MNLLSLYVFATVVSAGVFYGAYYLLLRNEPGFRFNRIYLLVSLFLTVAVPLLIYLPASISLPEIGGTARQLRVFTLPMMEVSASRGFSLQQIFMFAYFAVAAMFAVRFWKRISAIRQIAYFGSVFPGESQNIVWCDDDMQPFSFFRTTYLPVALRGIAETSEILKHERVHTSRLHSLDIMLTQLMQIFFWFNPFIPLIEKALREIHEFEADHAVLAGGSDPVAYTRILIGHSSPLAAVALGNNFNYSLIKRRLTMIYKSSTRFAWLKVAITLPLCLGIAMLLAIGCRQQGQQSNTSETMAADSAQFVQQADSTATATASQGDVGVPAPPPPPPPPPPVPDKITVVRDAENLPQFPGGTEALMNFLGTNIKYPVEARDKGITGTVYVQFVVKADGKIGNAKVIRGFNKQCDAEALRVVKSMPAWKPGTENGVAVDVVYNIPVNFALK